MGLAKHQVTAQYLQAFPHLTRSSTLETSRHLPVLSPLRPLFGEAGLPKGCIVALNLMTPVSSSLALALAAATTKEGSWVVALGWPKLGLVAARGLGVNLDRLVLTEVNSPKDTLIALDVLIGSVELIMVNNLKLNAREVRHLTSRLRSKGTTVISINTSWSAAPDITLCASVMEWQGLGCGHGYLQQRRLKVWAYGRRGAAQRREVEIWMPGHDGGVEAIAVVKRGRLRAL